MTTLNVRIARGVAVLAALGLLAACGLPRSGPNRAEIFSGVAMEEGDAFILTVDDRINAIAGVTPALAFSEVFLNAPMLGSDTIQPGDVLGLTIWENVNDGLLVSVGMNAAVLDEVQVDGSGFIFVPYAGHIRAAGNTPEAVRLLISEKLEEQTPDPQVQVSRLAGDGSSVSIAGGVAGQGVYPIQRPTRTLANMLANAGGLSIPTEIAQVTVVRGAHTGTIWFEDLYTHPANDIALRHGDQIIVREDRRSFTALGATGTQTQIRFDSQSISAIEALARVAGLSSAVADPTGFFVFRNETEANARALLGRDDLIGAQRVVYVLDLTRPNGIFFARDFAIRDDDTVYVTEAPFVQFNNLIAALTGTLSSVGAVATATSGM